MTHSFVVANRPKRRRVSNEPLPPWRERVRALRYVPKLIGLVWQTHRGFTAAMIVLRITRSFVPLSTLWVGKLIIDVVVRAVSSGTPDFTRLWRLVVLELGIVVGGEMLARASSLVESLLGDLFSNRLSVRIMEHAALLDLHQFEDPAFYDHMERARRGTVGRIGLLTQILGVAQDGLTLLSLSAALFVNGPWLLLLLAAAVIPSFVGETHFASLAYSMLFRWTPQRRELDYLRWVGASDRTAKEVQMFGLAPWLIERYRVLADRYYEENKALSVKKSFTSAALSILGTLGYYAAYVVIILRAVRGTITIGTLSFLAGSFSRSRDLIQRILLSASDVYEESLYLRDLFEFFEMEPEIRSVPGARPVPNPIRTGFDFDNVGFQYPGSDRWAVRHASFELRAGERIALVGENGAGKTTITKLLARLYDPTEGRILLDGVDLREYDVGQLRRAIGVIFQDFVKYDMRFDENVGVGEIDEVRDYLRHHANGHGEEETAGPVDSFLPPPTSLIEAAEKSLAATLLPRFPARYRQMLGKRFEDGVDLSGGEWQKVALARAYMREAQVLILDEPTAALDARAEYDVFVRFNELMSDRMAVVISHRFSTVRMADRIIVLRQGEAVEDGTHEELLARGGLYAELFQMQAAGYR